MCESVRCNARTGQATQPCAGRGSRRTLEMRTANTEGAAPVLCCYTRAHSSVPEPSGQLPATTFLPAQLLTQQLTVPTVKSSWHQARPNPAGSDPPAQRIWGSETRSVFPRAGAVLINRGVPPQHGGDVARGGWGERGAPREQAEGVTVGSVTMTEVTDAFC